MGDQTWEDQHNETNNAKPAAPRLNASAAEWTPSFAMPPFQPPQEEHFQQFHQFHPHQQQHQFQQHQFQQHQFQQQYFQQPAPPVQQSSVPVVSDHQQVKQQFSKTSISSKPAAASVEQEEEEVAKEVSKLDLSPAPPVAEEVEEEEEEEGEERVLPPADPRDHLNVVFIGHVDAGKSTLSGSILYAVGAVDERTIDKYKREAKETNRESWFLAFILDTNEEERARGKTVEVGRAHFSTAQKRFTILDAPGHKNYVPAMIAGAAQADVGILVISARKGEFEAGFDRLGQTREHAMLAKTLGVQKLIVVINKMDEQTVMWSQERYEDIVRRLTPFLKQSGFKVKKHVIFLPVSAITGANVKTPIAPATSPWAASLNEGKSLLQLLDEMQLQGRDEKGPFRMPVLDRYVDRGLAVMGKIECGFLERGQKIVVSPTSQTATVDAILAYMSLQDGAVEEMEVAHARVGENVTLKLKDLSEEEVQKGFVLCGRSKPLKAASTFVAQLQLLELLPHRPVFTAGYKCVLHVHTAIEECAVLSLLREMDQTTGRPKEGRPRFVKSGAVVWCRVETENAVCVEAFKEMMPLGRFTLRDEGKTIAIGKVIKVDPPRGGNLAA